MDVEEVGHKSPWEARQMRGRGTEDEEKEILSPYEVYIFPLPRNITPVISIGNSILFNKYNFL